MALIYTRSTAKTAKGYSRTDNMEANSGVATLAVVNPGKRTERNPYQWIAGRGTKHRHASPAYKSMEGAAKWGRSHAESKAKLYPTDDRGTVLGRPISRRNQMAYNIGALRRGRRLRRNSHAELLAAARAIDVGRKSGSASGRRRTRRARSKVSAHTEHVTMPGRRRRSTSRKSSKRSRSARKAARTRAAKKLARSMAARKAARSRKRGSKRSSKRRSSKRRSSKRRSSKRRSSKRRSSKRRSSKRRSSKRRSSKRRSSKRRSSKRRSSKRRSSKRRSSKRRSTRKGRRRSRRTSRAGYYYMGKKISRPGIKGLESWFARGMAPQVTRVPRLFNRPRVTSWKYGAHLAKIARGSRRGRRRSRRTSRKAAKRTSRRSKRSGRRSSKRRSKRGSMKRRSRRSSKMAANRRRRRRRSLFPNMLAQRTGKGRGGRTSGRGKLMQVVQLGPRSRRRGYPVTVAQHTLGNAYVRRFKFGGIAKQKHLSKRGRMAANRRRISRNAYVLAPNRRRRRRSVRRNISQMSANRRRRRRSVRRNISQMSANRRRRRSRRSMRRNGRRLRRNILGISLPSTADITSVIRPTVAGAAGFVGARLAGNAAQRIPFVAGLGPWGGVLTDLALGIAALTVGEKLPVIGKMIRTNQSALVVGIGLDAVHRALQIVNVPILSETMATALPGPSLPGPTAPAPEATSGFGAYVDVSHAGAPYKGMLGNSMGEYVETPLGDAGIFSANLFDGMNGG